MSKLAFTCDVKGLRGVTSQALRTMSSTGVVQVLTGVHLTTTKNRLTAVTTDMEVGQRLRMKLTDAKPGTVVVPAKQFDTILSTLDDGEVSIEQTKDGLEVRQGTLKLNVHTFVPEDYPVVPEADKKVKPVVIMAEPFKTAYSFVKVAASKDASRPVLQAVCLEPDDDRLFLAATDSYRMAWTWSEATCNKQSLVGETGSAQKLLYTSCLDEVARLLKDDLSFAEIRPVGQTRWVSIMVGDTEVLGRSVDGQFPNWRQLIPDTYEEEIEFDREVLHKSLARIVKLTRANGLARFGFFQKKGQDDVLSLVSREQDSHELVDTLTVKPLGAAPKRGREPMELGVNALFAKEAVGAFSTDNITMCIINPLRPSMFRADRPDEGFLVMPVRLV